MSLPLCQEIERATRPVSPNTIEESLPRQEAEEPAESVSDSSHAKDVAKSGGTGGSGARTEKSATTGTAQAVSPILELDIKLAGGSSAALTVRPGDVPQDIAQKFAEQHGLSPEKQQKLASD